MMDVEDEFPKCANAVRQAADALSTLQTENEKLRAELEQVKRERDAAIHDMRQFSIDWWESANGFPCMYCKYQLSDGNCKWKMEHKGEKDGCFARQFKWRGPKED
ncbi:hypothetical protein WKS99_09785 [Flintibacter sp. HCN-6482]|uniref:hypothetical protein n=1 Tax=Flintibacter sp. HCN-6482 TaxID=3134672 RepID=UPI0030BE17CB